MAELHSEGNMGQPQNAQKLNLCMYVALYCCNVLENCMTWRFYLAVVLCSIMCKDCVLQGYAEHLRHCITLSPSHTP